MMEHIIAIFVRFCPCCKPKEEVCVSLYVRVCLALWLSLSPPLPCHLCAHVVVRVRTEMLGCSKLQVEDGDEKGDADKVLSEEEEGMKEEIHNRISQLQVYLVRMLFPSHQLFRALSSGRCSQPSFDDDLRPFLCRSACWQSSQSLVWKIRRKHLQTVRRPLMSRPPRPTVREGRLRGERVGSV